MKKPNRMLWEQVEDTSNVNPLFMSASYAGHLFFVLVKLCFGYLGDLYSPVWSRYQSLPYREDFDLMITKLGVLFAANTQLSLFDDQYEAWREVADRMYKFSVVGDDMISALCYRLRGLLPDASSARQTLGNDLLRKVLYLKLGECLLAPGKSNPTLYLAQRALLNQIDLKGPNTEPLGLVVPDSFDWHTDETPKPINEYAYESDSRQVAVEAIWTPEKLRQLRTAGRQILGLVLQTLDVFDKSEVMEVGETGSAQVIPPMKATPSPEPQVPVSIRD